MVSTKTKFGFIRNTEIVDEMRNSYLDYAMSVIVSRALPDIRDGLKPVQRRIIYAMKDLGMRPNSPHKKCARLVGEVLGKWHPHGESAVYDALVRMAQPFTLRMPLVDGQGNFGSVDNDPPAAMRYTESRMATVTEEMLTNIDQNTVDFTDNFDGSLQEPNVLPTKLPNLLINGASGIAVGMATNIPPHNPTEICDALIHIADNPNATNEKLMQYVKGPDFPTGGIIMGNSGMSEMYATGRGQIIVRSQTIIEPMRRSNRMQIIVNELPYQVNKATLIQKIASLAKDRKIDGISNIRDESDRDGMRIVIELRTGTQPHIVLNNLYKLTPMQSTFSANMLALINGMPRIFTLKQALQQFIDFRLQIIQRRTQFDLERSRKRAHVLAGLQIAINDLDNVIRIIRASENAQEARKELIEIFSLDEEQAQAILDMQLRRLAALEREHLEKEYKDIKDSIETMESLLSSKNKMTNEVKRELRKLKKQYGEDRLTQISNEASELSREELEPQEQIVVTLSRTGYIKRIPSKTYKNQHRGGKGVAGMSTRNNDAIQHLLVADTHDRLLFFTNKGRIYSLKAFELRGDTSRNTRGMPIVNILPMSSTESVSAVINITPENWRRNDQFLVLSTTKGKIKRVTLESVSKIRSAGIRIMNLNTNDELVSARLASKDDNVIMVTQMGMSIRFPVMEAPLRQRAAGGTIGMKLQDQDNVVTMDIGNSESNLLIVTKHGFGKMTSLKEYNTQHPGGKGMRTFKSKNKTDSIADAQVVDNNSEIYVVSEQAQVLRTNLSEIRNMGRATQGVRIFNRVKDDVVASIACVSGLALTDEEKTEIPNKEQPTLKLNA